MQAYRLRKPNNPSSQMPRYLVATFTDARTKNRILETARNKGYLLHNQDQILVFQDLTPETLQKRKELTVILKDLNIRHR